MQFIGWAGGREALSNASFGDTLADYTHYSSEKRLMMFCLHAGPEMFIIEVAGILDTRSDLCSRD